MEDSTDRVWQKVSKRLAEADPAAYLEPRKPRVSRRSAITAGGAIACAALLVGAGGGALGMLTATATPAGPMAADQPMPMAILGNASAAGLGSPATKDEAVAGSMPYGFFGSSVFQAGPGVADAPGEAAGYAVSSAGTDFAVFADKLAGVFDIGEASRQAGGAWELGSTDGSGPSIYLYEGGLGGWSYSQPSLPTPAPPCAMPVPEPRGEKETQGQSDPVPGVVCSDDTATPSPMPEDEARSRADSLLRDLGAPGGSGATLEWSSGSDEMSTWVTAWLVVQGQQTQVSWSFSFDDDSLMYASGVVADVVATGSYATVGARTAIERSQQVRWAAFGPTPVYAGDAAITSEAGTGSSSSSGAEGGAGGAQRSSSDPAPLTSGRVQVVQDSVAIATARPTLAQYWQPDGSLLILPAYALQAADDRGEYVVIAVDESAIDFVAPQFPAPGVVVPMAGMAAPAVEPGRR